MKRSCNKTGFNPFPAHSGNEKAYANSAAVEGASRKELEKNKTMSFRRWSPQHNLPNSNLRLTNTSHTYTRKLFSHFVNLMTPATVFLVGSEEFALNLLQLFL